MILNLKMCILFTSIFLNKICKKPNRTLTIYLDEKKKSGKCKNQMYSKIPSPEKDIVSISAY